MAVCFLILGSSFVLARNSNFSSNSAFFTMRVCTVDDPGPWLSSGASTRTRALAFSTCYFVSPVHNLDDFIADNSESWSFKLGSYNLGLLFRDSFKSSRLEIAQYYQQRGLATNPWATSVRDFWLDFGLLAPLAYFPLGLLVARVSPRSLKDDELAVARTALLLPWAVMLPFISPLVASSLVYPIVILGLLGVATRLGMFRKAALHA